MIIISLDGSFAKSGVCISKVVQNRLEIIHTELIVSNKDLDMIPRILDSLQKIDKVVVKYNPSVYIKEEPFIGRASTAKPVLYYHALLELDYYNKNIELIDIHNATLKAFCKKYMIDNSFYTKEELKQFNKKEVVAEFLKCYFSSDMKEIYTERGRLIDDIADACALSVYYYENLK